MNPEPVTPNEVSDDGGPVSSNASGEPDVRTVVPTVGPTAGIEAFARALALGSMPIAPVAPPQPFEAPIAPFDGGESESAAFDEVDHGHESDDEDHVPALSSYPRCSDGRGTLAFLFFSDDDVDIARAKAICSTCGLQEACLAGAIEREEPYGVWGGKLMIEGVPVEFKRRRGRPRKNPLPPIVVDEVPIPPHLVA